MCFSEDVFEAEGVSEVNKENMSDTESRVKDLETCYLPHERNLRRSKMKG